jgi:hypothetical protein
MNDNAITIQAAENLENCIFHAIALNDAKLANNAHEALGIIENKPNNRNMVSVRYAGESRYYAGDAISKGDKLTVTTSGWFTSAGSFDPVIGVSKFDATSGSISQGIFQFVPGLYPAHYLPTVIMSDGITYIGSYGGSNYAQLGVNGFMTLVGNARAYQTEWLNVGAIRTIGANIPTETDIGIGKAWRFSDAPALYECATANIKVPKNIDTSAQPKLLIGWGSLTADPGDDSKQCRWEINYLWRAENESMAAAAEATVVDNYSSSTTSQGMVITEVQLANLAAGDNCLIIKICRRSDNSGDTLGDNADLYGICLYYTINTLGEAIV